MFFQLILTRKLQIRRRAFFDEEYISPQTTNHTKRNWLSEGELVSKTEIIEHTWSGRYQINYNGNSCEIIVCYIHDQANGIQLNFDLTKNKKILEKSTSGCRVN